MDFSVSVTLNVGSLHLWDLLLEIFINNMLSKFTIQILYFHPTICKSLHINNPTFFHCEIYVIKTKCNWTLLKEYLIHHHYTLQCNSHTLSTFWFTMLNVKDQKVKVREEPYFHLNADYACTYILQISGLIHLLTANV